MSTSRNGGRLALTGAMAGVVTLVATTVFAAAPLFDEAPPSHVSTDTAVVGVQLPDGVSPQWCALDGNRVDSDSCLRGYLVGSRLSEGPHAAEIKLEDEDVPRPVSWTVDTQPPTLTITQKPSGWLDSRRATLRYSADDDGTSTGLRYWCSHQARRCSGGGSARFDFGGEGRHSWTIHVTDEAGNVASQYGSVGVDLGPPRVRPGADPYRVETGKAARLGWQVTELGSGVSSFDARLRSARANGPWSRWARPPGRQGTRRVEQSLRVPTRGKTVCIQVRARDRIGYRSPWTREVCRSGAVDASRAARTGQWHTAKRGARWQGRTAEGTRQRGATLTQAARPGAKQVLVVAQTARRNGRVRVSVGRTVVSRINLARRKGRLSEFRVPVPRRAKGPVRVTVTSQGRPVWIDSVGVVRASTR